MRRLLMSPLHWPWSRWFMVVIWRGRKNGRRYATPVSYVEDDGVLLVTTGDAWWRNLQGGAHIAIWLRGRNRRALGEPVTETAESVRLHERMFRQQPLFALLAGLSGPDQRHQIRTAVDAGRTMIRIRPVTLRE
jgi:hypothetical protein